MLSAEAIRPETVMDSDMGVAPALVPDTIAVTAWVMLTRMGAGSLLEPDKAKEWGLEIKQERAGYLSG